MGREEVRRGNHSTTNHATATKDETVLALPGA